jgi:hypothetical protein
MTVRPTLTTRPAWKLALLGRLAEESESNGKHVTREGAEVSYPTRPAWPNGF